MRVFALTGGIASGKSTVSGKLARLGAAIVDTDMIAHELAKPGMSLWKAYTEHFGDGILLSDGTLNRRAIGQAVFRNAKERQWIDGVSHPIIRRQAEEELSRYRKTEKEVAFLDVPLLFEAEWESLAEAVWVVYVPLDVQISRLRMREGCDEESAMARIFAQMPLEEKRCRADVVIDNSGPWEMTEAQVEAAWRKWKRER